MMTAMPRACDQIRSPLPVLVAVGFPGVFDRLETLGIDRGQAFGEGGEELFEVAQGGDGMDDGYHGADYKADHRHAMRAKSHIAGRWPRSALLRPPACVMMNASVSRAMVMVRNKLSALRVAGLFCLGLLCRHRAGCWEQASRCGSASSPTAAPNRPSANGRRMPIT